MHLNASKYEWLLHTYICWCMWMSASHVHLLVYVNGCFICTSVGVYEQLFHTPVGICERLVHTHICWCMWMAGSHVQLLVYMNGCFTRTSVAAFRDHNSITTHLVSSQTLWTTKYHHTSCIITNCMDYKISPHILYYHKLYMDLAVSPHIKYLYKGFVWTIMYHHTSTIITNSCMDYTVSPHIKYHHKVFVWTIQYHHSTQHQLHITVCAVSVFLLSQHSNCLA
jgi:hypothetical protein